MKKQILLYILFWIPIALFAQKHDYIWHFGQSNTSYPATVLDFNFPNDSIYIINRPMRIGYDNTSICDTAGNLLFYTNGIYIEVIGKKNKNSSLVILFFLKIISYTIKNHRKKLRIRLNFDYENKTKLSRWKLRIYAMNY